MVETLAAPATPEGPGAQGGLRDQCAGWEVAGVKANFKFSQRPPGRKKQ